MSLNEDGFNDGVCILGDCLFQWNTSSSLKVCLINLMILDVQLKTLMIILNN